MRNTWKVKPDGKRKLQEILRVCTKGDTILLSPGEYHFPSGLFLGNPLNHGVNIKGIGKDPKEVVINGTIAINGKMEVSLTNLSINALHESNGINISQGATVNVNRVILNGELTGSCPAIHCTTSTLNMAASELSFSKEKIDSIFLDEQSEANIRSSILPSIYMSQSNVFLHNNQITVTMSIVNNSVVNSTGILDLLTVNESFHTIVIDSGARANFHLLNADQHPISVKVEQASLALKKCQGVDGLSMEVYYDTQSTVDVPDDNVLLFNVDESNQPLINAQMTASPYGAMNDRESLDDTPSFEENLEHFTDVEEQDNSLLTEPSGLQELQALYGLHDLKKKVNEFINLVKYNKLQKSQNRNPLSITLNSLFIGNPGTGKTSVARILGRVFYEEGIIPTNNFIEVTRKDLVSPNIGETAQKTQQVLEQSRGGILFIDEAYTLYNESAIDHGKEAIDTLLTFMEDHRQDTMIIFAGYTDEMNQLMKMNSGFESRVKNTFYFDDYTPEEIGEIGYADLTAKGYTMNEKKYKEIIAWLYSHSVDKSNARWVRNMNEKLLVSHANRVIENASEDTQTIMDEDIDSLIGSQQHDKEEMIQNLLQQLDDLTGLEVVKSFVHRLIKEAKVDRMLMDEGDLAEKPSYHMIFAGNPGTGKTTVASIIGKLFHYLDIMTTPNVKVVDRSDLVGPYVGHTEKKTKEILEQSMGGVLFIDEAYQLTGTSNNDFGKQAIEMLLTYLENHRDKFIVILAGYTKEMDQFLEVNPGLPSRIPHRIVFPDYSPEEVATIVEKMIAKDWQVNTALLQSTVIDIYAHLPDNEKSNARWARNFSERLIQHHKSWVADSPSPMSHLRKINDEVILNLQQEYLIR